MLYMNHFVHVVTVIIIAYYTIDIV